MKRAARSQDDYRQTTLIGGLVAVDERVPATHPLRKVRAAADVVLGELADRFQGPEQKRFSLPAEQVLRSLLLWALYGVPSERRLLEDLDFNLLFRWFVGLDLNTAVWPRTTFRLNRRQLQASGLASEFLARALARIRGRALIGNDHFHVNWSLVEAWSGQTSLADLDDDDEAVGGQDSDSSRQ